MKKINPRKVFAQYRGSMNPYHPIMGRKYTITHSDITAELFVFIAEKYAEDQINELRDEVRITWKENKKMQALTGTVLVDGQGIQGNANIRNKIFLKEMPTALQALRQADRFLFEKFPNLDNTPVLIHFISKNPSLNKIYHFGPIGNYK